MPTVTQRHRWMNKTAASGCFQGLVQTLIFCGKTYSYIDGPWQSFLLFIVSLEGALLTIDLSSLD